MGLNYKNILGVKISIDDENDILEEVRKYLKQYSISNIQFSKRTSKTFIIYTPNPEIINYAQRDKTFKEIVNSAQINLPDGMGIAWALKRISGINIKSIPGVDLMKKICQIAGEGGYRIGIIG